MWKRLRTWIKPRAERRSNPIKYKVRVAAVARLGNEIESSRGHCNLIGAGTIYAA
jgi:hypothetical protein